MVNANVKKFGKKSIKDFNQYCDNFPDKTMGLEVPKICWSDNTDKAGLMKDIIGKRFEMSVLKSVFRVTYILTHS